MVAPGGRLRPPFLRAGSRLLAAALDVALHELLGVLLEDIVDLVEEVVEVLLDLLALLGDLGVRPSRVIAAFRLGRSRFLLLLLGHERLLLRPAHRARRRALDRRQDDTLLALVPPPH